MKQTLREFVKSLPPGQTTIYGTEENSYSPCLNYTLFGGETYQTLRLAANREDGAQIGTIDMVINKTPENETTARLFPPNIHLSNMENISDFEYAFTRYFWEQMLGNYSKLDIHEIVIYAEEDSWHYELATELGFKPTGKPQGDNNDVELRYEPINSNTIE